MLTLFKERYEVLATAGAGGEAQIVKALDRQHGRIVALKVRRVRDDYVVAMDWVEGTDLATLAGAPGSRRPACSATSHRPPRRSRTCTHSRRR